MIMLKKYDTNLAVKINKVYIITYSEAICALSTLKKQVNSKKRGSLLCISVVVVERCMSLQL